ncbi:MAG: O-antigen ligase family protein [bacterium]
MTRTREYCRRLIEGACLLMLIVVPIFFNIFSSRVFDPDKSAILRSLAVAAVVVASISLILRLFEEPPATFPVAQWLRGAARFPLAIPIALFALVTLVSTLLSIAPVTSFWGSYLRLQGAYTTFAYLVLAGGLLYAVRDWSQVERVARVIVLTSVPVALYGIVQKVSGENTMWSIDTTRRIISTVGNPIFLGAYLVMVLPLALRELLNAFSQFRSDPSRRAANSLLVFSQAAIVMLQAMALVMSGSRGPLLGAMLGFTLFVALHLLRGGRRWLALGVTLLPFVAGLALMVNQALSSPARGSREAGSRFVHLLNVKERNSQVRIIIWKGILDLVVSNPELGCPDIETDSLNAIRPIIGFGPETMMTVFSRVYPPQLGRFEDRRTKMADRAHCETWNVFLETGTLGVIAYLLLFAAIFHQALRGMGLIRDRMRSVLFAGCCAIGAILAAAVLALKWGLVFLGPAIPMGMLCGVFLYIWIIVFLDGPGVCVFKGSPAVFGLLAAIASALFGNFAEIQVGIPTVLTRVCFWAFVALLLLVTRLVPGPEAPGGAASRENCLQWSYVRIWGLLGAAILLVFAFDLVINIKASSSAAAILSRAYLSWNGIAMVVSALLVCAVPVLLGVRRGEGARAIVRFAVIAAIAFLVAAVFSVFHAMAQASLAKAVFADSAALVAREGRVEMLVTWFYLFVFGLLVLMGFALCGGVEWKRKDIGGCLSSAVVFIVVAGPLVYGTNLRLVHADICLKSAHAYAEKGSIKEASLLYQRAISLDQTEERCYVSFAEDLFAHAKKQERPVVRERALDRSAHLLSQAQALAPYKYEILADLGLLYCWWATVTTDQSIMTTRGRIADTFYAQVLTLSPNHVNFWTERAYLSMRVLNRLDVAERYLQRAMQLDPEYSWPHKVAGDFYYVKGKGTDDGAASAEAFKASRAQYSEALRTWRRNDPLSRSECQLGISRIMAETGDVSEALVLARQAYRGAGQKDKAGIRKYISTLERKSDEADTREEP